MWFICCIFHVHLKIILYSVISVLYNRQLRIRQLVVAKNTHRGVTEVHTMSPNYATWAEDD